MISGFLKELEKDRTTQMSMSDCEFMQTTGEFILEHSLTDKREINYVKIAREVDPYILKVFVGSLVQNFYIKNGKVESISFKNGAWARFLYKGGEA